MSDLHGCYEKYLEMLDKISFSSNDTLYILGDVVDRGEGGIKILQDMMKRKNMVPIMGNHEGMALCVLKKVYNELEYEDRTTPTVSSTKECKIWFEHGGFPTYHAFLLLHPKQQLRILDYIESFKLECNIRVSGKEFYLAHSSLKANVKKEIDDNFRIDRHIWQRTDYKKKYFQNKYFVSGHSPTFFIGEEWRGQIYNKNNHIAIDCGLIYGERLACVCLNNMNVFYV